MTRAKRKNRNGVGSPARLRKDGRYEARATLNTTTGRRRVSFYGTTGTEAEDERLQALADQAKGASSPTRGSSPSPTTSKPGSTTHSALSGELGIL